MSYELEEAIKQGHRIRQQYEEDRSKQERDRKIEYQRWARQKVYPRITQAVAAKEDHFILSTYVYTECLWFMEAIRSLEGVHGEILAKGHSDYYNIRVTWSVRRAPLVG